MLNLSFACCEILGAMFAFDAMNALFIAASLPLHLFHCRNLIPPQYAYIYICVFNVWCDTAALNGLLVDKLKGVLRFYRDEIKQ